MAEQDRPDREKFAPGKEVMMPSLDPVRRVVRSARFDDRGHCYEWTDTRGDVHRNTWTAG